MDSTTYLNRYQLCRGEEGTPLALQRGPGGVTYQAEDIETDQPVAVKLVPSYSFAPDELQQLEKEARAAQQVIHPNIARLHGFGFEGGDVVFVTEILDGTTLDAWVTEHGPLAPAAVVRVALQVVAGLAAAAFHSVAHRSIQPATLMIVPGQTPDGEWPLVKVLNFGGVPPAVSASEFSTGRTGRSADFASPEQLKGYPVDFRSEIYSLGCTMWFLLTGAPPMPGTTDKSGAVPRALRPILAQMVSLDPMQRPQDPVALQDQLRDCLGGLERRESIGRKFGVPVAAPSGAAVDAAPKPTQLLKPLALAAAFLVLIGIGALALPYLLHSDKAASEPIGVPVGIPDKSADAAATERTAAVVAPSSSPSAAMAAPATTATATPAVAAASVAPTAEPAQALVSVEPPRPGDSAAPENAATVTDTGSSEAAVATAKTSSDQSAASEQSTPAEVAEGGAAQPAASNTSADRLTTRQPSAESSAREQRARTASSESPRTATAAPIPEATRVPVVKSTPKPSSKVARGDEVRRAEPPDDVDANAPAVPRGSKRARYLGTTPEGDLVFGLPSDQRGYVAPAGTDNRRRRSRRSTAEPPTERVLPAEPLDPNDE
ncbi:MAG: protein kinase [Verrucomicrobiota bacterium]|nr:protein kinase [Verrucomicrobiota bacterium]